MTGDPVCDLCLHLGCSVEQVFVEAYRHAEYEQPYSQAVAAYQAYMDNDPEYDFDRVVQNFAISVLGDGVKPHLKALPKKKEKRQ